MDQARLDRWRTPASAYPRARVGVAEIKTAWYTPGHYPAYEQRGYATYQATRRLYITSLQIEGKTWMVDDPPHWWAMEDHATYYHDRVLCAGLGLGLIVHTLTANPEVSEIVVVERELDVINLVSPHLPQDKLTIIHSDFYDIEPEDIGEVDGVLYDLLVGNGEDLLGETLQAMATVFGRWETGPDFVGRAHGYNNAMLEPLARRILQATDEVDALMRREKVAQKSKRSTSGQLCET